MTRSSDASSSFRIDWRPSRWLGLGLMGLGGSAALALWLSALPGWALACLVPLCLVWGLWQARHELRRAPCRLSSAGDGGPLRVWGGPNDGPLDQVRWRLRGPIAVLSARDHRGRRCHFVWGPDTLSPSLRRRLKLAGVVSSRYDKPLPSVAA